MNLHMLTQPIHLPFLFLPFPSIAAAFTSAALCCALLCWGMFFIPTRWPFKLLDPVFPAHSPIWAGLALLLSLSGGVRGLETPASERPAHRACLVLRLRSCSHSPPS
jgi:hypothetical protein